MFDGAGNGATGDTVIYGFAFNAATYAPVFDSGGHLIGAEITYTSADGPVTDTITNVEHFQFADQTLSVGQIFAPTAPAENVAVADTVAVDAGNMLANGNALVGVTDVDVHTTLSVTAVNGSAGGVGHDVTGSYGTLEMNSDGTYSYTANPALDALPAGTTATDTFQFTVTDSNGGATTTSLNFNITGAADTPVVNAVVATAADTAAHDAGTIVAHGNLITDAGDSDRDAGVTLTVTAVGSFAMTPGGVDIANTYGTLHVNSDGSYTFTANAAFDALTPGQTPSLLQAFTVSSSDGASQTSNISLTITGAADTPVVNAVVATAADTAAHDAGTIVAHGNLITDAGDSDRDARRDADGYGRGLIRDDARWRGYRQHLRHAARQFRWQLHFHRQRGVRCADPGTDPEPVAGLHGIVERRCKPDLEHFSDHHRRGRYACGQCGGGDGGRYRGT